MSEDERVTRMADQVSAIHTVLLGVDGQGGLCREVETIKADVLELKGFKSRLTGIAVGASALVSVIMAKIFGDK